ncbi:MAG: methyltransferase domain-containing protein [Puniceicoccales bacterium]
MKKWQRESLGRHDYQVLNLDHPDFVNSVIEEIEQGEVGVYYDTRWKVCATFTRWLDDHADRFEGKRVLVLGCGVGTESLVVARYAAQTWCNDWSPVACHWCEEQMRANDLKATFLPGSFAEIELPAVDWIIGSFLVYNPSTARTLADILQRQRAHTILANEPMPDWARFRKELTDYEVVEHDEHGMIVGEFSPVDGNGVSAP